MGILISETAKASDFQLFTPHWCSQIFHMHFNFKLVQCIQCLFKTDSKLIKNRCYLTFQMSFCNDTSQEDDVNFIANFFCRHSTVIFVWNCSSSFRIETCKCFSLNWYSVCEIIIERIRKLYDWLSIRAGTRHLPAPLLVIKETLQWRIQGGVHLVLRESVLSIQYSMHEI